MDAEEMYSAGRELEMWGSVDDLPAMEEWYRKAAAAGSAEAMGRLGLHLEGAIRAQKEGRLHHGGDFTEAARWYRKAADGGDSWAAFALGRLYADKFDDWEAAEPWFRKAAAAGRWQAKEWLAGGPAGVRRRRLDSAFVDQLSDRIEQPSGRVPARPSSSSPAAPGGCLVVAAFVGVLPVLLALLAMVGRSG